MSNPTFSIIIPAYNAENHIRKALDSIASQTYKSYELIVICDSCTDNTQQIAQSYGAITEAVQYHRDGLSRDRGLQLATGEWVLFMDDDDWFLHEFCLTQLVEIISHQPEDIDAICFGYVWRLTGYTPPTTDQMFKPRVARVWSKAWRRSAIGDAHFGAAVFCSDTYFLRDMKARVRKVLSWNMPIYYYNFRRPGSQTDLFCQGKLKESPVAE